jgi:hypothetical protein
MSLSLNFEYAPWKYTGESFDVVFRRLIWLNAPKLESDREFANTNFFWDSRFTLVEHMNQSPARSRGGRRRKTTGCG